jgi:hypothetical protein
LTRSARPAALIQARRATISLSPWTAISSPDTVNELARDSQPHRALWDTTGTALLLGALVTAHYPDGATIDELLTTAGLDAKANEDAQVQGELFN